MERNDEKVNEMLLTRSENAEMIGDADIKAAAELLQKYKNGKKSLETRVVNDEKWWELRHWDVTGGKDRGEGQMPKPTSAWLFNTIVNKHADAMDNMPEPIVLPREASDKDSAKILSDVLPVIMEYNNFEDTYSDNWWEKLKHGTAAYGIFWNSEKENGLGDIDIKRIDLLKIFWEPGIMDIQDSKNLFIVDLVDTNDLKKLYPDKEIKEGKTIDVKEYTHDDTIDTTDKSVVVDWYYKTRNAAGKTIVNYAKFVGETLLYASENTPEYRDNGYYDHGMYPVVFDCLFPEKDTPVGFGFVAVCKEPQLYIDSLSGNILESAMMCTKKRFFISNSAGINEKEFLDWNKPFVHVTGEVSDARVQEIVCQPLSPTYLSVMQDKVDEMKDTAGNRDINSGGTGAGVTSGAAIASLQEAGNKVSRNIISAAYRAYARINSLVIELIRQFYEEERMFRITMPNGEYDFVGISNAGLKDQSMGYDEQGIELVRKPIFDLKIKAQKKNPFSRMEENERAKELFGMGFFNPDNADMALMALDMMTFEGIEEVKDKISQGKTMANMLQQAQMLIQQLQAENYALKGTLNVATDGQMESLQPSPDVNQAGGMPSPDISAMPQQAGADGAAAYRERLREAAKPTVEGA